jgi:hypothetical protein
MKLSIARVALLGLAFISYLTASVQAQHPLKPKDADSLLTTAAGVVRSDKGILGHVYLVPIGMGTVRSDKGILGTIRLIHDTNEHRVESDLGLSGWLIIGPLPDNKK